MENIREFIRTKVQKEYDDYIDRLCKKAVRDVVNEAYTIAIKSEILGLLINKDINENVLQKLNGLDNILDVVYYAWLKEDLTNSEDIRFVIYKYTGLESEY